MADPKSDDGGLQGEVLSVGACKHCAGLFSVATEGHCLTGKLSHLLASTKEHRPGLVSIQFRCCRQLLLTCPESPYRLIKKSRKPAPHLYCLLTLHFNENWPPETNPPSKIVFAEVFEHACGLSVSVQLQRRLYPCGKMERKMCLRRT